MGIEQAVTLRPGRLWSLTKNGETLICAVFDHPIKEWELQLHRDSELIRSEACWTAERAVKLANRWRLRAMENGWAPCPT